MFGYKRTSQRLKALVRATSSQKPLFSLRIRAIAMHRNRQQVLHAMSVRMNLSDVRVCMVALFPSQSWSKFSRPR